MSTTSLTPNPTSIPWNNYINSQSFNVTGLDGTPVTIGFSDINALQNGFLIDGIVRGFAIGFCSLLFILLLILTPSDRRKTAIFLLNMISLFLLTFFSILGCIVDASSYTQPGPQLLRALAGYGPSTWAPSVMGNIIQPALYGSIMTSLVLQTRVVFAAEPTTKKIVTILGALATLVEFAFVMTNSVYDIISVYATEPVLYPKWIYRTIRLYFLVFVGICCVVFLYKLGTAVRRRSKMGINVRRFGPFQIIFVTFAQCLIVPRTSPPQLFG
jgi:pheromone alpha factor receptor